MSLFFRFRSGFIASRTKFALLAAVVLLPNAGCLSIGGRTELVGVTDEGRVKALESRVDAIEKSLGITPPPPIISSKPSSTTTSQAEERKPKASTAAATDTVSSDNIQHTSLYIGPGR